MWRRLTVALCVALAGTLALAAEQLIYTPAQAAYLKGEIRKAQERFVEKVAAISGVQPSRIKQWVPTDGRDVPPKMNIVPALQRERGKPLSDEERSRIVAADQERYEAIEQARQSALKR